MGYKSLSQISWGIIGCGDVTELKSGPAFNKTGNSKLVAVMRRNAEKAADYARRHGVPKWYSDGSQLINDPEVTAVYVATPPDTHASYAIEAMRAGKPVYVEKPMARKPSGMPGHDPGIRRNRNASFGGILPQISSFISKGKGAG